MRCFAIPLLAIAVAASASAQSPASAQSEVPVQSSVSPQPPPDSSHVDAAAASPADTPNLPAEQLGKDDLVGITVYDSPELSRTVRVDSQGKIRLPMVRQHIQADGLSPSELEKAIAAALVDEQVLVDPIVSVSVVEYHSRPITVTGAVRAPQTFQATGSVTLLEAIVKAGGLNENAGAEIEISHPSLDTSSPSAILTERIPRRALLDPSNPASNIKLEGGETIRVPSAGQIFVAGNVKRPGPFIISNDSESSVLRALSIAGGLDSFSSRTAYIYRTDEISGNKSQIPIQIKKIIARKSPDIPLYGDDMLYVPNEAGQRATAKTLEIATGVGLAVVGFLLYVF